MPFYVYNEARNGFIEKIYEFDKNKVSIHSDNDIPLEFACLSGIEVLDNRNIEPLKLIKLKEIEYNFTEAMRKGSDTCYVTTPIISKTTGQNIIMDNGELDLTNINSLIELMVHYDQTTTTITDYFNQYHSDVTLEEVIEIKFSMILRGAELHTKKGTIRYQISQCTTIEELNNINWTYVAKSKRV